MVSVLNKEPKYKVEKLKYTKMEVVQTRIKNKPSWISPHKVLQSRLINTVYHLLVKNNKGEGSGGLRGRGLLTFFPRKGGAYWREGAYLRGGGLIEDLR